MPPSDNPLFVDLDGTLIASDSLLECLLLRVRKRPFDLFRSFIWLIRGRACLKTRLAADDQLNIASLPYRRDLCEYLKEQKLRGRSIYLATATDTKIARRVADHLGLFRDVLASDGHVNLKGARKLAAIQEIAKGGFTYAGNSRTDLVIWNAAASAILVNAPRFVVRRMQIAGKVECVFSPAKDGLVELMRSLRIYQWSKNLLVFVPLLTSFQLTSFRPGLRSCVAFLAFSFCASATYVINDLIDLASDRAHPRKRFRPFAAGTLDIPTGLMAAMLAMCLGLFFAFVVSFEFGTVVVVYVAMTMAYSLYLKSRVIIDVVFLATLYAIRIGGGAVAIDVSVSVWLLAFAMFVFLSLALMKRCAEIVALKASGLAKAPGRNYELLDLQVLWPMGIATAISSVVVFSLYIHSAEMPKHYQTPSVLWLVALALFYWIARMWIKTGRGEMTDDPIVFAATDFGSRAVIAAMIILTLAGYFLSLPGL